MSVNRLRGNLRVQLTKECATQSSPLSRLVCHAASDLKVMGVGLTPPATLLPHTKTATYLSGGD